MSEDIVKQARRMVAGHPAGTHYAGCHEHHSHCMVARLADEVERLRDVIRRIAEQGATVSVQGGSVTVTLGARLTDAERDATEKWIEFRPRRGQGDMSSQRDAIRRIAGQDATASVCEGNVTVTLDAGLTKNQRDAVGRAYEWLLQIASQRNDISAAGYILDDAATLRGLLQRPGGDA